MSRRRDELITAFVAGWTTGSLCGICLMIIMEVIR